MSDTTLVGADSVSLRDAGEWHCSREGRPHRRARSRSQIAASGLDASGRHLLPWSLAAGWRRVPGYWVPAAQVLHGLAVLPLDGVFEQVRQVPAGGDAGDGVE